MSHYILETIEIEKKYGSFCALDHVNIHVKKGDIYGLVGDNGAGKSTLLKLLAGHTFKTSGEMVILGESDEKELQDERKKMGFLIESTGYFPDMTVKKTLQYYSLQKGVSNTSKVDDIINLVGLTEKSNCICKKLSLGQKQRLGIAIALLGEPQILVLDEPINGLDPSGIIEMRTLFERLNTEKNITIIISSHILTELQQIATQYGFLSNGKLIEEISAQALHEKCANCVEIALSNIETYTAILSKVYANEQYKVFPNNIIRIYKPKHTLEEYSKIAADNHIYITGLKTIEFSLEDYYMNIKKEAN